MENEKMKTVFKYFEEIMSIPRESGKEERIAQYLINYAKENINNVDICTIAPTIEKCHSVNERVSISSTKRVYKWLKDTLIRFNKLEEA